ncbi:MAG: hypothetical protein HKN43_17450 [Rhodothermales bacterium]|nr:hypothetical protein [Rhodothermales bacterium]
MASCTSGDNLNRASGEPAEDDAGLLFSYRQHNGLDCFMVSDCGFLVEIDSSYSIKYYEDSGTMSLRTEGTLTAEDFRQLTDILARAGFSELPEFIPHPDSKRGRRTLTIMSAIGTSAPHTVTVFEEETDYPFPESFLSVAQELRAFLLGMSGVETGMRLDRTPRKF